jgi:hypothetical protein
VPPSSGEDQIQTAYRSSNLYSANWHTYKIDQELVTTAMYIDQNGMQLSRSIVARSLGRSVSNIEKRQGKRRARNRFHEEAPLQLMWLMLKLHCRGLSRRTSTEIGYRAGPTPSRREDFSQKIIILT